MKKINILSLFVFSAVTILTSCNFDNNTIINEEGQRVTAYIMESEDYLYKQSSYDLKIEGKLMASPLPEFNYFKIDGEIFSSRDNFTLNPGYIDFYLTSQQASVLRIYSTVYFEVNTEFGAIFGNQSRPALIDDNIEINGTDADYSTVYPNAEINLSDMLEVSWTYGSERPDFLHVYGIYSYHDGFTDRVMKINEYIDSSYSFFRLFNSGVLQYNGRVNFNIEPYNGPIPGEDSVSNMSGDGTGTLYWSHLPDYCELEVQVGNGYKGKDDIKSKMRDLRLELIRKNIFNE
ncbi:MAG: hypothetical protein JXN63_08525 [Candidatus Delongbacteria bacterium]|nr:hypothetical protein [Candidatus Delongbacteria bacterium]